MYIRGECRNYRSVSTFRAHTSLASYHHCFEATGDQVGCFIFLRKLCFIVGHEIRQSLKMHMHASVFRV